MLVDPRESMAKGASGVTATVKALERLIQEGRPEVNGQVWLQGLIKAGAVGTIATLPPPARKVSTAFRSGSSSRMICTRPAPSLKTARIR